MTKCVFCGKDESPFKGVNLIANDGSTNFYCSRKCRINARKLKRDKTQLKWTEAYRIVKQKTTDEAKKQAEKAKEKKQKEEKK